jgi:hypothetical protein
METMAAFRPISTATASAAGSLRAVLSAVNEAIASLPQSQRDELIKWAASEHEDFGCRKSTVEQLPKESSYLMLPREECLKQPRRPENLAQTGGA